MRTSATPKVSFRDPLIGLFYTKLISYELIAHLAGFENRGVMPLLVTMISPYVASARRYLTVRPLDAACAA
jgi:hypothetical protein